MKKIFALLIGLLCMQRAVALTANEARTQQKKLAENYRNFFKKFGDPHKIPQQYLSITPNQLKGRFDDCLERKNGNPAFCLLSYKSGLDHLVMDYQTECTNMDWIFPLLGCFKHRGRDAATIWPEYRKMVNDIENQA